MKGSFFGLITIAIGAEIPDTIQSVTMAKRGYGSMAVSNALGSQIINILIGLGLPWLLVDSFGVVRWSMCNRPCKFAICCFFSILRSSHEFYLVAWCSSV